MSSTTSASDGSEPAPGADGNRQLVLGPVEKGVAVGLVLAFLGFMTVLILLRSDAAWDRLVYLFGGLEALVFAAAGALFGTAVQRGQAVRAQEVADRERHRADANEREAVRGRGLAALIRAKRDQTRGELAAVGAENAEGRGARPESPPPSTGRAKDLEELGALADQWFPSGPS